MPKYRISFDHGSLRPSHHKLLYKPLALGIGNGKFWPPTSRKPFVRFWRNLKIRTTSRRPPGMQDYISLRQRGWSGRTPSFFPRLFSFFFDYFGSRTGRTRRPIYTKIGMKVRFQPFGGLDDDQSRLGIQTRKNQNFGDVNTHFKPNL